MKLLYGIAVASVNQLAELPELKKAAFLEVPSSLRELPDFRIPMAWKRRFRRVTGRSEARTLSSLIDAKKSIQIDFLRVFAGCCEYFSKLGAAEISLGVDWEAAFSDPGYALKVRDILRSCYGITEKYSLTPILELRIPGSAAAGGMDFYRFRNSLMIPVRVLIDLHPHEPGALELMERFSATMPFVCDKLRISFDAAGGNYLTGKLLERICKCVRPAGVAIPEISFYPGRSADHDAFAALNSVIP